MRHKIAFALSLLGSLCAAGCGGSGGGSSTPPPANPTITSVSVSCSPTSITTTQTSTCVATISGTGSYSQGVTWTATGGTVTSVGAFTPTTAGTSTITATSTEDSTKSGQASVTVTVPVAISSVSVTANPTAITTAQTSAITAAVQGTGAFSSAVTWTATNGTVSGIGNSVTFTPTAVGTATITACSSTTGFTTVCGSTTIKVTAVPTVSVVTLTGVPATLQVGQTAQLGCAVTMSDSTTTGACTITSSNSAVASINATTDMLTAIAAGTANIVATSTLNSAKSSAPATLTVKRATPVITSVSLYGASDDWMFCPISCSKAILAFAINGTGFQVGDQFSFSGYWAPFTLTAANINSNGTQAVIGGSTFGDTIIGASQPPNFIYFTDVPQDGTPESNTVAFAYLDGYNSASHGPNGELLNQYMGKAYVWQNAGGSLTNTLSFSDGGVSNIVYETDGNNPYFVAVGYYALDGTVISGPSSDGWPESGTSAENGTVIVTEPGGNEVALYKPVPFPQNPQANRVPVEVMPYTSVMTTINGNTFGFVASVDGTPTLWKIDTNGTTVGSAPLTGFTSRSDINATNRFLTGGWPMAVFHTGTAAGKVAVVSTHDKSLLLYDGGNNTLPLLQTVALPCEIPWAVDAVDSTGKLVVACIKVAGWTDSGTTFLSVDAATGNVTPLTSVSIHAPNGFPLGFLADADNMYIFSGPGAPDVQPNK